MIDPLANDNLTKLDVRLDKVHALHDFIELTAVKLGRTSQLILLIYYRKEKNI